MKVKIHLVIVLTIFSVLSLKAQQQDSRKLSSFNKISTDESFDVFLNKGTAEAIRIVAVNIDPKKINTKIEDGTLRISSEKGNYRNVNVQLYITYKELNAITSTGSSSIEASNVLTADNLILTNNGSGKMKLAVKNDKLTVKMSGSGAVSLTGTVNDFSSELSGSGRLNAFELIANTGRIGLSGSGVANVNVKNSIKVDCNGSGKVHYKGNPATKTINSSGSGKVSAVNN